MTHSVLVCEFRANAVVHFQHTQHSKLKQKRQAKNKKKEE